MNSNTLSTISIPSKKLLTRQEEAELAKTMSQARARLPDGVIDTNKLWKEDIDPLTLRKAQLARDKLIYHNRRLVASVANKFKNQGCDYEDLIQEGNIGLITGIDKFDWKKNLKISTYCTWWIRQRIERLISNKGKTVRVPVHIQNHSINVKKFMESYFKEHYKYPDVQEIKKHFNFTIDMTNSILSYMNYDNISFDYHKTNEDGNEDYYDFFADPHSVNPHHILENDEINKQIINILNSLPARDEQIIRLRFGIGANNTNIEDFPISKTELKHAERKSKQNHQ